MSRSKSSGQWLREHFKDIYVKQSHQQGYRSRASYKLLELNEKDQLLRSGMRVVDLGAAPGGWSQVAAEKLEGKGRVIASDILPMDSLAGVEFIQGDFTEDRVLEQILRQLGEDGDRKVDLVISDMAPNISGMAAVDQPRAMYLVELALAFAQQVLRPGGGLVVKAFQGEGFEPLLQDLKGSFKKVLSRKPKASRGRSREVYLVAKGLNPI